MAKDRYKQDLPGLIPKGIVTVTRFYVWQHAMNRKDEDASMNSIMTSVAQATANTSLASFCLSQLPRAIQSLFEVKSETDAYMLAPRIYFLRVTTKEVFETKLEPLVSEDPTLDGLLLKVPEDFIAKLCVVV